VRYLGYVLSEKGVFASSGKVTAVRKYRVPINVKDVRTFLCLALLYRRLVPNIAEIAKSLKTLIKKNRQFT
jgi:hypothetical protein